MPKDPKPQTTRRKKAKTDPAQRTGARGPGSWIHGGKVQFFARHRAEWELAKQTRTLKNFEKDMVSRYNYAYGHLQLKDDLPGHITPAIATAQQLRDNDASLGTTVGALSAKERDAHNKQQKSIAEKIMRWYRDTAPERLAVKGNQLSKVMDNIFKAEAPPRRPRALQTYINLYWDQGLSEVVTLAYHAALVEMAKETGELHDKSEPVSDPTLDNPSSQSAPSTTPGSINPDTSITSPSQISSSPDPINLDGDSSADGDSVKTVEGDANPSSSPNPDQDDLDEEEDEPPEVEVSEDLKKYDPRRKTYLGVLQRVTREEWENETSDVKEIVLKAVEDRHQQRLGAYHARQKSFNDYTPDDYQAAIEEGAAYVEKAAAVFARQFGLACSIFLIGPDGKGETTCSLGQG
ncbi:hypothetical protein CPB85DRAFT_1449504 [Mucidula mucida]|nr:hypothetical protein CPB85DRAFT_1449504 [Mucidula mucida]